MGWFEALAGGPGGLTFTASQEKVERDAPILGVPMAEIARNVGVTTSAIAQATVSFESRMVT